MDYGQGQAASNMTVYPQQGPMYSASTPNQDAAMPADTLVRAISSLEELNKRLQSMVGATYQIAEAIGGPYPVAGNTDPNAVSAPSAMARLNHGLDRAHRQLSELDDAMSAIKRSLGA